MSRYHPLLVALHWILALAIVLALFMGTTVLGNTPNSDPQKIDLLRSHMTVGLVILGLMVLRLIVRYFTQKPAEVDTGNKLLNMAGKAVHYLFYLSVILMAGSGIATSKLAGLPGIVFDGSGAPLPENFDQFAPRIAHGILATILMLLIAGHVLGFLFHQFGLKDKLFSRMWFGRRIS